MPRRLLRAAAALGCLAATVVGTGDAANADASKWITAPCATGSFTGAEFKGRTLMLYGNAAACGRRVPGAQFAIVLFHPQDSRGMVNGRNMRPYLRSGTRAFGVMAGTYPDTQESPACLMSSFTHKVACAVVTVSGTKVALRRICPHDPRVSKPVEHEIATSGEPDCGTCF